MLKYRIITALILIPLVIATLFWLPPVVFAVVSIGVCMLAAWEWGQFSAYKAFWQRVGLALLCGIGLSLILYQIAAHQHDWHFTSIRFWLWLALGWWLIALLLVLFYPGSAKLWRNSKSLSLLFGVITIMPFFCGLMVLRYVGYPDDPSQGAWWLLYVMLLVWGADTGAYMFGRLFGKHKLSPKVSPGKTWEGVWGGLLTSAVIAYFFSHYMPVVTPVALLVSSIAAVAASILGDLTESMFKREAGIKDSSQLIPGHGGILDRIDSLTAAVPVFACFMLLIFRS